MKNLLLMGAVAAGTALFGSADVAKADHFRSSNYGGSSCSYGGGFGGYSNYGVGSYGNQSYGYPGYNNSYHRSGLYNSGYGNRFDSHNHSGFGNRGRRSDFSIGFYR